MNKIVLLLLLVSVKSFATNYYVAKKGSNSNTGTSINKPWQTIDHLNKQTLKAGDSVLFMCSDTFVGQITIHNSGNANNPIVFSSYGIGAKPVISGATKVQNFKPFLSNIYKGNFDNHVFNLYANGEMQINARYPNKGLLKIDSGTDQISFYDSDLTQASGYWKGATIRFRTFDWEYRTSTVTAYTQNNIVIADSSTNTLSNGWGYYFDNKFEELDTCHEWFYDKEKKSIFYVPSIKNSFPNIEVVIYSQGISIEKNVSNVNVQNLVIEKFETDGIIAKGNNENITIKNNVIQHVNVMGINFKMGTRNCVVSHNRLYQINGRGISALEPENLIINGNNVSKIGNIPGYGFNGVNGMIGITIENDECKLRNSYIYKTPTSHIAINNTISNNIVDSIGYVGIRLDGANSLMEQNVVKNALLFLSDGAAIYCWANGKNYTYNNIIRNNIVFNMIGNNIGTPNEHNPVANGIYIDNNVYNVKLETNIIFNITGAGVQINSDSYNNSAINNTIYNCQTGIMVSEWATPNSTFGNVIEQNTVFNTNQTQRCIMLINWVFPSVKNLATFNNNTYISQFEKYYMVEGFLTEDKNMKVKNELVLSSWQKMYGFDLNSKAIETGSPLAVYKKSKLCYNETEELKTFDFKNEVFDLNGQKLNSIQLKPFTSQIIISK